MRLRRSDAIDALGEEPEVWEDDDEYGMGQRSEWCHFKKIIEKLPSAQPQRKMGKWMSVSDEMQTWYHCSECHYQQYDKTNFCPSCGADMDGENDA